jgi:hypothetical protein
VHTTISAVLLKQISRIAADTTAATGHAVSNGDGIATNQKERSRPMKTKSFRFAGIASFSSV